MRNRLAAFSLNSNINAFDLALTKTSGGVTVNSLLATTTEIYAGGDFDAAGTTTRRDFVGATISPVAVTATDASPDANVYAIALNGTSLVYGGAFTHYSNNTPRNYLGVIAGTNGTVLPQSFAR